MSGGFEAGPPPGASGERAARAILLRLARALHTYGYPAHRMTLVAVPLATGLLFANVVVLPRPGGRMGPEP